MPAWYLLDASALYPLLLSLREDLLKHSDIFAVLDLTVYEVGNVIWKEYRRGRISDPGVATSLFQEVFRVVKVVRLGEGMFRDALRLAIGEGLTFYDASYLYTARMHGVKLVTEDRELQRFPESISVSQLLGELGLQQRR